MLLTHGHFLHNSQQAAFARFWQINAQLGGLEAQGGPAGVFAHHNAALKTDALGRIGFIKGGIFGNAVHMNARFHGEYLVAQHGLVGGDSEARPVQQGRCLWQAVQVAQICLHLMIFEAQGHFFQCRARGWPVQGRTAYAAHHPTAAPQKPQNRQSGGAARLIAGTEFQHVAQGHEPVEKAAFRVGEGVVAATQAQP